jgi:hypothetical protein
MVERTTDCEQPTYLCIDGKTKSTPQKEYPQKIPQKQTIPKFSGEGDYRFVNTGILGDYHWAIDSFSDFPGKTVKACCPC